MSAPVCATVTFPAGYAPPAALEGLARGVAVLAWEAAQLEPLTLEVDLDGVWRCARAPEVASEATLAFPAAELPRNGMHWPDLIPRYAARQLAEQLGGRLYLPHLKGENDELPEGAVE